MPMPFEICLEELDLEPEKECFVRCVALSGGEPGLVLDRSGEVQWMPNGPSPYGLWVSADDQLVLFREEGAAPIHVERRERSVEAPEGKPVILRDQDILRLGERRLRVHAHGQTEAVYAPERLSRSAFARVARAAAVAAALALGGGAAAAAAPGAASGDPSRVGEPAPIEVRVKPPRVAARERLDCTIGKQTVSAKSPLVLTATCKSTAKLSVGLYGSILDPKTGGAIADGGVSIKSISGQKIVVEAPRLRKRVQATIIRFWVDR